MEQGANLAKGDDACQLVGAIDHVQIRDIVGVQSIDDLTRSIHSEMVTTRSLMILRKRSVKSELRSLTEDEQYEDSSSICSLSANS